MANRAFEIMTRDVTCVSPGTRASDALTLMCRERIRHLPVLERGRVVGILSDRDLLGLTDDRRTVDDTMTRAPFTCSPATKIGQLAELMIEQRIDALPIVSGEHLVGIVTSTDLLALLASSKDRLSDVLPFDFNIREFRGASLALPA